MGFEIGVYTHKKSGRKFFASKYVQFLNEDCPNLIGFQGILIIEVGTGKEVVIENNMLYEDFDKA